MNKDEQEKLVKNKNKQDNNIQFKELASGEVVTLEENESIIGVYKGHEPSKKYSSGFSVNLEVEGNPQVIFVNNIVIDQIVLNDVKVGQTIKIEYLGKVRSTVNPQYYYKDYKVYVAK